MVSTKQRVVLFVLIATSGAVWAPRLISKRTEQVQEEEVVPAILDENVAGQAPVPGLPDETGAEVITRDTVEQTAAPVGGMSEEMQAVLPAPTDGAMPKGLSARAEEILRAAASSLEEIERRREAGDSLGWSVEGTTASGSESATDAGQEGADEPGREDEDVALFLAENAPSAILVGEEGSLALVGGRVVRVGDRLLGGRLTIAEITAAGVRYRYGHQELDSALPPFRAETRTLTAQDQEEDPASDSQSADTQEVGSVDSTEVTGA